MFDTDLLYKIRLYATPRVEPPFAAEPSLGALLEYADEVREKYLTAPVVGDPRPGRGQSGEAKVSFIDFPGGNFTTVVDTNQVVTIDTGHRAAPGQGVRRRARRRLLQRSPGFFRSINYAPQFYKVPLAMKDARELKIPKTLLELEGNTLFNFDPRRPEARPRGQARPAGRTVDVGRDRYKKDDKGNFRFVYSGRDAQAGRNINAVIVELPLAYITRYAGERPDRQRLGRELGQEGLAQGPDHPRQPRQHARHRSESCSALRSSRRSSSRYKLVDTDGQPFADAALNEREDDRQLGANNILLARIFVIRLAHLGWGFGPSIRALGLAVRVRRRQRPGLGPRDLRARHRRRFPASRR